MRPGLHYRFRIADLRPGRYRVEVRRKELVQRQELELVTDHEIEIELLTHDVSGRVIDADEAIALAGAGVTLLPTDTGDSPAAAWAPRFQTDSRGLFRFIGVAAGSYRLRVEHRGYVPLARPIAVAEGTDLEDLELRLAHTEGLT